MKVQYDQKVDALYLQLSDQVPDGAVEIAEGVNIDTTKDGLLTGIEILNASKKMDITTIMSYTLDLDGSILSQKLSKNAAVVVS